MNKNFIIAGAVVLVLGLAIAIGVTLSSEPVAAGLPEGDISVVAVSYTHLTLPTIYSV